MLIECALNKSSNRCHHRHQTSTIIVDCWRCRIAVTSHFNKNIPLTINCPLFGFIFNIIELWIHSTSNNTALISITIRAFFSFSFVQKSYTYHIFCAKSLILLMLAGFGFSNHFFLMADFLIRLGRNDRFVKTSDITSFMYAMQSRDNKSGDFAP